MHTHYFGADVAWCSTNQLENVIIVPSITTMKQWINKTQHTVCFETFDWHIYCSHCWQCKLAVQKLNCASDHLATVGINNSAKLMHYKTDKNFTM